MPFMWGKKLPKCNLIIGEPGTGLKCPQSKIALIQRDVCLYEDLPLDIKLAKAN